MRQKANGIEAFLLAANDSGVEEVFLFDNGHWMTAVKKLMCVAVPLKYYKNQRDFIADAILLSASGKRAACVIDSRDLSALHKLGKYNNYITGGLAFFVLEDNTDVRSYFFAQMEKLTMWTACDVVDAYSITKDALDYSELEKKAQIIIMCRKHVFSYAYFHRSKVKRNISMCDETFAGAERRKVFLDSKYNYITGHGKHCVIAAGDAVKYVDEICSGMNNIVIVRLVRVFPVFMEVINKGIKNADRIIVIESTDIHVGQMLLKYKPQIFKISDNDLEAGEGIYAALYSFLPSEIRVGLKNVSAPEERGTPRVPTIPEKRAVMCPGCEYRIMICRDLGNDGNAKVTTSHYCTKRLSYVVSGIISDRVLELECDDDGKECRKVSGEIRCINTAECDGCGDCISATGCPALSQRGFNVRIDPDKCEGCGLCVLYCKKEAICIQQLSVDSKQKKSIVRLTDFWRANI